MATRKRVSVSSVRSESPLVLQTAPNTDSEEWVAAWRAVLAKDIIDSPVVSVDAETSVEDACELLLSKDIACLAVKTPANRSPKLSPFYGLFDFADVNAFLILAATRHKITSEELREKPRVQEILTAAKDGKVAAYLISNLSEKNPLEVLPHDATIIQLLTIFARGTHRVLVQAPSTDPSSPPSYLGLVSDRALLAWLTAYAQRTPPLLRFLSVPLSAVALPSLYLYAAVVAAKASDKVLDAMRLMSDEGVSSVAVVDDETKGLLSAVSVTDIGKVVVPAQSNAILGTPLKQLVTRIKEPDGSTDGVDKSPVYSVTPNNTLLYTMQKLLATNSHRLFVTEDSPMSSAATFTSASPTNLCGIVSVVDVLAIFARIANIPDVDPTRMQRHRRASSTSSSSTSDSPRSPRSPRDHIAARSRSGSRTGLQRRVGSVGSFEGFQTHTRWAERVPVPTE
ncbi:hypothetical protein DICSQDRAFT_140907 [Dichomitus squalens LYAD-421 SS1]|uniref:CBS domain-containing protein n=1 Tax=Dichomitus squalens (strain LYAD-421) TaxID=732165 RepID=R7SP77_DICSQ|nr:uncharacterized protein DICSQDRAFT_140907 [Dichomitus squalens LYAD-421 SS1]EJF56777.1 hypothetical protein DICSQDRAFT_140907 [Dichomitus squalens LYAD-421 SS1]